MMRWRVLVWNPRRLRTVVWLAPGFDRYVGHALHWRWVTDGRHLWSRDIGRMVRLSGRHVAAVVVHHGGIATCSIVHCRTAVKSLR